MVSSKRSCSLLGTFALLSFGQAALAPALALADDALVLPQGVFRFTAGSSFVNAKQSYNQAGEKADLGAELGLGVQQSMALFPPPVNALKPTSKVEASIARQDLGLEYGWSDVLSISARLPMYLSATAKVIQNDEMKTALAALNTAPAPTAGAGKIGELFGKLSQDGKNAGSLGDLLLGAKYQFAHSGSSPISAEPGTYRAAFAIGAKLPTGTIASPDTNDISTLTDANTKSMILGGRTYFDYQFTDFFYLNVYTEHEYRFAGSTKVRVTPSQLTYQVMDATYRPGFYNHLELDFVLTPKLTDNLLSESGVRLTGDFTGVGKYTEVPIGSEALLSRRDPASNTLSVNPYIGFFYTGAPFPMKLKFVSYLASGGRNAKELTGFSGILYAYLKF